MGNRSRTWHRDGIYVRPMGSWMRGSLRARLAAAVSPFFSADGQWIGFFDAPTVQFGAGRPGSRAADALEEGQHQWRRTHHCVRGHRAVWRELGPRQHDCVRPADRHHACVGRRRRARAPHQGRRQGTTVRTAAAARWRCGPVQRHHRSGPQSLEPGADCRAVAEFGSAHSRREGGQRRALPCERPSRLHRAGSAVRIAFDANASGSLGRGASHSWKMCNGRWASPRPARTTRYRNRGRSST